MTRPLLHIDSGSWSQTVGGGAVRRMQYPSQETAALQAPVKIGLATVIHIKHSAKEPRRAFRHPGLCGGREAPVAGTSLAS